VISDLPPKMLIVDEKVRGEAMDTTASDQEIVNRLLVQYAQLRPSHVYLDWIMRLMKTQSRRSCRLAGTEDDESEGTLFITLHDGKV